MVNKGNLWSSDDEDGFYVAYHQLLYHWLVPGNAYHVYLDKKNSRQRCVDTLRGKKTSVRRVLTVIELEHQYYVVVLDEVKDIYKISTAFPAIKSYYEQRIRGQGANAGAWG